MEDSLNQSSLSVFQRRTPCQTLEIFAEEAWVREIQLISNLSYLQAPVTQHHLCTSYYRTVNPLLCRDSRDLTYHSSQISVKQYGLIEQTRGYNLSNAAKGWLPQIGISAGAFAFTDIIDADMLQKMEMDMENYLLNGSVTINQNIYDGGQIAANRKVTRAQSEVENRQLDVTMYDVEDRVQQIYFGILMLDEQLKQNRLLQDDLGISYKSIQSMMDGGIANQSDMDAVKVEQLKAQQQESSLNSVRTAYLRMLGVFIGEKLPVNANLEMPASVQVNNTDVLRPELSFYDAQESLLTAQRKLLNSRLRPTLSAFATGVLHNSVTEIMNNSFILGGVSFSWNFGALYTRKNDLRKLETQRQTVESNRETFLFNTRLKNEDSNGTIEALRKQISQVDEIVRLRESIRGKSESKVLMGTESVNEMLRDINAVSQG